MPATLPTEVKLQMLKHYIDLCVEDAADISEYERPRSMYYTIGVPEQYHANGQVCLLAIENLLTVEPSLRVDTHKLLKTALQVERRRYYIEQERLREYHGSAYARTVRRAQAIALEKQRVKVDVLLRVLQLWW